MLRCFGIIWTKNGRGCPAGTGGHPESGTPSKVPVTGPSLLVNCYLRIKFHKKISVNFDKKSQCWRARTTVAFIHFILLYPFTIDLHLLITPIYYLPHLLFTLIYYLPPFTIYPFTIFRAIRLIGSRSEVLFLVQNILIQCQRWQE